VAPNDSVFLLLHGTIVVECLLNVLMQLRWGMKESENPAAGDTATSTERRSDLGQVTRVTPT